ncbi:unnamed protein product [Dibothriocephalus latus]|uniref:Uncharacterized protein n=1 Tax=Dibothriocephalus latus TaxID=60516 RepID=A0A3P7LE57_DIBLA|nr:unnamed protein product [Dibothriocephalus latus]
MESGFLRADHDPVSSISHGKRACVLILTAYTLVFSLIPLPAFRLQKAVTDRLIEVANKFLESPTDSFSVCGTYLDIFTGERARICVWLGIMRFLTHFLYAAPTSDAGRRAQLRDAFASRLVLSFLDFIEAQMLAEDCRSLAFLLIALTEILVCIAEEPSGNKEVECQWHNCSVYVLLELRRRFDDKSGGYWDLILTKITEALDILFLSEEGSRFAHGVCRLDDLPKSSGLAKYHAIMKKACTCARNSLSGQIRNALVQKAITKKVVYVIAEENRADAASALAALKGVLVGALREPFRVHSGGHLPSLEASLDTGTREALVTCLSTLQSYESEAALVLNDSICRTYSCAPLTQLFQSCFSTGADAGPLHTAQFSQLVYIAQRNQLPRLDLFAYCFFFYFNAFFA